MSQSKIVTSPTQMIEAQGSLSCITGFFPLPNVIEIKFGEEKYMHIEIRLKCYAKYLRK